MHTEPVFLDMPGGEWLTGTYAHGTARPEFAVLWVHGFGSHRGGEKAAAVRAECAPSARAAGGRSPRSTSAGTANPAARCSTCARRACSKT